MFNVKTGPSATRLHGVVMRLICHRCQCSVSTEVPEGTIVRAFVECPGCIMRDPIPKALERIAYLIIPPADNSEAVEWQKLLYNARTIAREALGIEDA
jgi:hypothetical protein